MRAWLPSEELFREVGVIPGVRLEVVEHWTAASLPSSRADVEVIVPPQAYAGEFSELVRELPRLRVVQALSAGVEQYRSGLPAGVELYNASGVHVAATAEWVIAAILSCQRDLPKFALEREERRWEPQPSRGLNESRVVIIGAGEIGTRVHSLLQPFGARVTLVARTARGDVRGIADIEELLPDADVVVLLIPHTHESDKLVDTRFLAHMKTSALLVNAARGAVVDSDALLAELANGRLRAALDVFDPEPPPADSPIWSTPGILLTPHVASSVPGVLRRQADLLRRRLPAFASGEAITSSPASG